MACIMILFTVKAYNIKLLVNSLLIVHVSSFLPYMLKVCTGTADDPYGAHLPSVQSALFCQKATLSALQLRKSFTVVQATALLVARC